MSQAVPFSGPPGAVGAGSRKLLSALVAFALVLSALLVGATPTYAEADELNEPLSCSPGTFYTLTDGGRLAKISSDANGNPIGTVEPLPGAFPQTAGGAGFNSLGIAQGGVAAYALQRGSSGDTVSIVKWSVDGGFAKVGDVSGIASGVVTGAIAGTVSREGDYFFGGWQGSSLNIYKVDPDATPLVAQHVGAVKPEGFSGTNGDFAFDKQGNLFIIFSPTGNSVDNYIFTVTAAALAGGTGGTLEAQQLTTRAGQLGSFNGIAFDATGSVLIQRGGSSSATQFAIVDPNTMVVDSSSTVAAQGLTGSGVDLGSCQYPGTITVKKDYPDGRYTAADQVTLSLQRGSSAAEAVTATTKGNQSGVQGEQAGPSIGVTGEPYTTSETVVSGAPADRYTTTYTVTKNGQPVSSGTGATWELAEFPQPEGPEGPDYVVTFSNRKLEPGFTLSKTADPASETTVLPGQSITYTVTGANTGETALDPVVVNDDLTEVLKYADLQGEPVAKIGDQGVAAPVVADAKLTWSGKLDVDQSVTISYTVKVKADASGKLINNRVTGSATPPDLPPIVPPESRTEHPIPTPGFDLLKSSDPASGSTVQPGDSVTYTVTGSNTGATVLDPVVVSDDLSEVLVAADLQGDPVAKIGDEIVTAPAVEDGKLTWAGSLAEGESVTITYSVKVKVDAAGKTLHNVAVGSATPPGPEQPPITPPPGETEHPVPTPGFELAKSADPATGSTVQSGDVVTYTVTGVNTGETVLDPVTVTDDLSEVLVAADLQGDPVAKIGDEIVAAPSVEGGKLTWAGSLAKGESVTITYSVKVKADAAGKTLHNVAVGSATPPGQPPITPPPGETEHPVPGFELVKSADPQSGVEVDPGDVVTYTVTGSNTGATVLDPVVVSDDLSEVLVAADLQGDPVAKIGDEIVAAPSVEGGKLSWSGKLQVGESVTITYSVKVKVDAAGKTLHNVAVGSATPPGQPPITPPPGETEHPVPTPGFGISKTSNPASGNTVNVGQTITYTVSAANTGETVLDPVIVTDSLAAVLPYAQLQGDPVAKIGGQTVSAPVVDGSKLTWTGTLEAGQSVVITYQVKVKAEAFGNTLKNVVTGEATPPGQPPIKPPSSTTEHPVPPKPTPGLPDNGRDAGVGIAAGLVLLLAGASVAVVRRRRERVTLG